MPTLEARARKEFAYVVAVTDEGDCLRLAVGVLETAEVLANHLRKRDGLAGVAVVG
jgi:hypothetical protein